MSRRGFLKHKKIKNSVERKQKEERKEKQEEEVLWKEFFLGFLGY